MDITALDTSQTTESLIPCLKSHGITAVGRYYTRNRTQAKILKASEASALSAAGIKIWAIYQVRQNQTADFSRDKGLAAARDALDYASNVIGQPRDSAIYFSVDYDATAWEFSAAVRPYFMAVQEVFAAAGNPYRIGVYGSGAVCKDLLDAGVVQLTWLSQSKGFRGTKQFKNSGRWNLNQRLGVKNFCEFDDEIDPDDVNPQNSDFGAFSLAGVVPLAPAMPVAARDIAAAAAGVAAQLGAAVRTNATFPGIPTYRGTPVHRGETASDDVKIVQSRLNDLRYGPLVVDGDFGEATQNALFHFQARNTNGLGHALDISGEVDESTWGALFGPGGTFSAADFNHALPMRELAIDIAASQIGVVEQPRGSNRGPEVDQYIRAAGLNPASDSFPWCVCFLYWVFGQAAQLKKIENPLPKTAGVHVLWSLGKDTEAVVVRPSAANANNVKPGMIFLLDTGGGHGHAGLVIGVAGENLVTIEGNTNAGGSADGYGVFRREARSIAMNRLLGYLDFCSIANPVA